MPILTIQKRMREIGRIRIGEQVPNSSGKGKHPAKLDAFRLTSQDERVIRMAAAAYGGEAVKWEDAPTGVQWQVNTEAKAIDVIVPPVAYAFSQWNELWSGGGCQRRCDGERMTAAEGVPVDVPCVCDPDSPECKPHTRLSLILRELEGFGTWRLESSGWNAATELAGTIDVLEMLQGRGQMVPARLLLVQRESRKPGQPTMKFAVPSLDLTLRVGELVSGVPDRPALTPIAADEGPAPSVVEQVEAHKAREPKPARANAQAALPPSGRRQRSTPAAEVPHDGSTGEIAEGAGDAADTITQTQANKIRLQLSHVGVREDKDVYAKVGEWVGRKVTSLKQITTAEMDSVLTEIGKLPEAGAA